MHTLPYLCNQHEPFHLQELCESVQHCLVMQQDGAADQTVSLSEIKSEMVLNVFIYESKVNCFGLSNEQADYLLYTGKLCALCYR